MVPGVSVGLSALKSILFDGRLLPRITNFDLLILRAVQDSGEYDLPWVQRTVLTNTVRKQMIRVAKERGDTKLMPEEVLRSGDEAANETLASKIAEALTAMGARTRNEVELDKARQRIQELERKLGERK
jgi:hypothetical protein